VKYDRLDVVTAFMFIGFAGFMLSALWDNVATAKVSVSILVVAIIGLIFLQP
jgi:hypothetical protein